MRYLKLLWIFSGFYLSGFAQQAELDALISPDCMESGSASVLVYDLDEDEDLFTFDDQRALPTASIQKMMSTAAALSLKGDDFKYSTKVGFTGQIKDGILHGDLVVLGSGDPSLGSDYFPEFPDPEALIAEVISALRKKEVKALAGNIHILASAILGQHVPGGWSWSSLGNYYGAGHWGLNIHDNEYRIHFKQNEVPGRAVSIANIIPAIPDFNLVSEVVSGPKGSGDQAYIYAAPYSSEGYIRGTIPPGKGNFSIRGSIPNPPLYFGQLLAQGMADHNISVEGSIKIEKTIPTAWSVLVEWNSPALVSIARITNYESVNMYAESMMKLLCEDKIPSDHHRCGMSALRSFWEEKGVDRNSFFFTDGSGLSPRNTASARAFVQALQAVYADKEWYDSFTSTLPKMGRDGTLQYMLKDYKGPGFIFAKSGYIGRQRSYSGYITTESGRHLAFCVILDNYSCSNLRMRNKIEDFLTALLKR